MKKKLYSFISIIFIIALLTHPIFFSTSIISGIRLCAFCVIPALLPMILLTNFMMKEDLCTVLSQTFHPILHRAFGVSEYGSFAVLSGFLCGFPVASKIIHHLYKCGSISKKEASFLAGFCNNCSFSFVANYVGIFCLKNVLSLPMLMFYIYLPPLLCGFLNHFIFSIRCQTNHNTLTPEIPSIEIIPDTFHTLVKITFYIIGFTTLTEIFRSSHFPHFSKISGLIEITSGIHMLTISSISYRTIACVLLCSVFGGVSSMLQCFSFLKETDFKISYIKGKLEQVLILLLLLVCIH